MKRASKAAEYAAKKHYTSYNKKHRNSAFHSGDFGGAELLKQPNTLLGSTILHIIKSAEAALFAVEILEEL